MGGRRYHHTIMSFHEMLRVMDGSAFAMGGDMFNYGNKIILPSGILTRLMELNTPSPFMFVLSNAFDRELHETHVGVHEFTAPDDACFVPRWITQNLGLTFGSQVYVRLARYLPGGTFVKIQPQTADFVNSVGADAKMTFEIALEGQYNALTVGDAIELRIGAVPHTFHVRELKPQNAVSLIDTSLTVEFMPPVEKEAELKKLTEAEVEVGAVDEEDAYYFFTLPEGEARNILVAVEATEGDPDIYVSRGVKPGLTNHTWQGSSKGSTCVVITPEHPLYTPGTFYVAIHPHKGKARFRLVWALTDREANDLLQASVDDLRVSLEEVPEGYTQCDNCQRAIPDQNVGMHEVVCARQNWMCPKCKQVMQASRKSEHWHCPICDRPRDPKIHGHCDLCNKSVRQGELEKHKEIFHVPLPCKCGRTFLLDQLLVHQDFECSQRAERCCYCEQAVPSRELRDHEAYCGGRTSQCPQCGTSVCNRDKLSHMHLHHNDDASPPVVIPPDPYDDLEVSLDTSIFNCPFCHSHCGSFEDLSQHIQSRH